MKLSVFVVTYNQEKYISQALDSILCQQIDFEYEIVVADDCSTDGTSLILDKYAQNNNHIKVYHNPQNLGFIKNWKFALSKCCGEYVSILEGDDYWLTNYRLQKQVELLDMHPEYGMCCAKSKHWIERKGCFDGENGDSSCESYETLLVNRHDVMTSTTMIRRNLFLKAYSDIEEFLPERLQWDTSIWFWFAANSKIYFIDDYYEVYRILDNSESRSTDDSKNIDYELIRPATTLFFINRYPIKDYAKAQFVINKIVAELESICRYSQYVGEKSVRATKMYKLGLRIRKLLLLR